MKILKTIILALCLVLVSCNNSYSSDEAIERGDIVDQHGNTSNSDRLDEFITNINSGKEDQIRITKYTIEGDPIFYNLSCDGQYVRYEYDNSEDKFGTSNVRSTTCKSLIRIQNDTNVEFKLDECFGKNKEIGEHFSFVINIDK